MSLIGFPATGVLCWCFSAVVLPVIGVYLILPLAPIAVLCFIPLIICRLDFIPIPDAVYPKWARPIRHALEPRHPSFESDEARSVLAAHGVCTVIADSAGTWPMMSDETSNFRYVRLHGEQELYASGYTDESLDRWAEKCRGWAETADVVVYFDNDAKGHAPYDAMRLLDRLRG